MIKHVTGNILDSSADALVNTVNTVGVMGKGIALQFGQAFPDNYDAYVRACEHGEVKPGHMFVFHRLTYPRVDHQFSDQTRLAPPRAHGGYRIRAQGADRNREARGYQIDRPCRRSVAATAAWIGAMSVRVLKVLSNRSRT